MWFLRFSFTLYAVVGFIVLFVDAFTQPSSKIDLLYQLVTAGLFAIIALLCHISMQLQAQNDRAEQAANPSNNTDQSTR